MMNDSGDNRDLSLNDLGVMLIRRKYLVLVVIAVVVAAGYLNQIRTAPVFEAKGSLFIGRVQGMGDLGDVPELVYRLKTLYPVKGVGGGYPRIAAINHGKRGDPDTVLSLTVQALDRADIVPFLDKVAGGIKVEHDGYFDALVQEKLARRDLISKQIQALETQATALDQLIGYARRDKAEEAALLSLERAGLDEQLLDMRSSIVTLDLQVREPLSTRTHLVLPRVIPKKPVNVSPGRTMAFSLLIGTLLAVVAVFLVEFTIRLRGAHARK